MQAHIDGRVADLAGQYPGFRLVIGGSSYFWGMDPQIQHDLRSAGMTVLCWPDAPLLDPALAKTIAQDPLLYNVIVFGDPVYHLVQPDPSTGKLPARIDHEIPKLRKFIDAGGGVWFSGLGEQNWGRSSHALNRILEKLDLDAEVLGEVVMDSSVHTQGSRWGEYAWVDVASDPLTEGVKNVLHPSGVITSEGSMGVCPIVRLGPGWRVLLRAKPTAASHGIDLELSQVGDALAAKPATVKSAPILLAVRDTGKGRVVLWPTWSNYTVTGGSGGMLVDGKKDETFSDGARLIENLLCWLAEPGQNSDTVGTFDPETYKPVRKRVNVARSLENWRKPGRRFCVA